METPVELSKMELRRYQAQIALPFIGIEGQHRIKSAKVLIIGAGGKGLTCMQQIASAGVGHIGICDNRIVTEDKLIHQSTYGITDLGKQKAIVAKEVLNRINHQCVYRVHNVLITESNAEKIASEYDVIVDATDSWQTKKMIGKLCHTLQKTMINASLVGDTFEVSVFNYQNGSSFDDAYPVVEHLHENAEDKPTFFLPSVLYSICGSLMANELIRILLNLPSPLSGVIARYHAGSFKIDFRTIG